LESLRSATDHAAGFVNARGAILVVRLHDIPNHVREVALHGVRHGVAVALVAAQPCSTHNLRLLPHSFLDMAHPGTTRNVFINDDSVVTLTNFIIEQALSMTKFPASS